MVRVEIPDFEIKIGIKDGKVISVDWSQMVSHHTKNCKEKALKYLKMALEFFK